MSAQQNDTINAGASAPGETAEPSVKRHDLNAAIRGGMFWNVVSFVMSQGSNFAIFLVMASRLPPEVFGIVALASILSDFVANDGRYACMDAIMQSGRYEKPALNAAFLAFMGLAVIFMIVTFVAAGPVSAMYNEPLVATFMPLFGVMILPVPWLSVMDSLMSRDLAFKQMTQRSVIGALLGGAAGIAAALSPWLVWALVVQRIVTLVVTLVLEYRFTRWLPGLSFQWKVVGAFTRRFLPLWVINALGQFAPRFVMMFFGVRFDGLTVGLLRAANRISESIQGPIINPMLALWFPLMAKVRNSLEGERQVYDDLTRTVALLAFPAFAGLILVADDVVSLFLPERYAGVAPLMRAVALMTMLAPVTWFSGIAMAALGMNRASLLYTIANAIGTVAGLFLAPQVSAPLLYLIASASGPIIAVVGVAVVNRRLQQTNLQYYAGLAPAALATAIMAASVLGLQWVLSQAGDIARLIACGVVGAGVYAGWLFIFHRAWLHERIKTLTGKGIARASGADAGAIV